MLEAEPYPKISIERIAAEAKVGKQSIYRWWDSKADVLLEAYTERAVRRLPSFKRSGELFGKPHVVRFSREVSQAERERFNLAVVEAVDRCSPMPFTESMGGAIAGRVLRIRFIDSRKKVRI